MLYWKMIGIDDIFEEFIAVLWEPMLKTQPAIK